MSGLAQDKETLNIQFTPIDSIQYVKFKNDYSNQLILDSAIKTIPDSSFSLIINDTSTRFGCGKGFHDCNYYKGFIPPLNCFAITHCSSYICRTFLVDKATGERHFFSSPYDNECYVPLLSKNLNKMLVIASNVFDTESYISVYERQHNETDFNYEFFSSMTTQKWKAYEAVWINETSIALITFEKYGGITGNQLLNVKYVKGVIK